jgi:hypothetical protein
MKADLRFLCWVVAESRSEDVLGWIAENARAIGAGMVKMGDIDSPEALRETVEIVALVCERATADCRAYRPIAEGFAVGADPATRASAMALIEMMEN